MNHPNHSHGSQHDTHQAQHGQRKPGLHKDWRVWTAVVLMLAAIVAYIMSKDEEIQPGDAGPNNTGERMPAAD